MRDMSAVNEYYRQESKNTEKIVEIKDYERDEA